MPHRVGVYLDVHWYLNKLPLKKALQMSSRPLRRTFTSLQTVENTIF